MKRILAVIILIMILALSMPSVFAAESKDNNKDSYQSYANKGTLKCTEENLLSFDNLDQFYFTWKGKTDTDNKKEGAASLAVDLSSDTPEEKFRPNCFETKIGAFKTTINDIRKETFKFWVYVNDIDYLVCDHDSVHENPQKDSGTLYVTFAEADNTVNEIFVQHTLEGSGWHLVEIDINCCRDYVNLMNKSFDIGYMKIWVEALPGLNMKFDGLKKVIYNNSGYTAPALENNGRWISTCDYDSVDGSIVSEWYGSSFDTSDKTQGSSSLVMRGRLVHEDYRSVWSGLDVAYNKTKDVFHFDMYIEDMDTLGTHFEQRMRLCDTSKKCKCESWLYYSYTHLMRYSNGGKGLKNGWNSIDIPLSSMTGKTTVGDGCKNEDVHDYKIVSNLMFWKGAYEDKYYTIKYDNMYLYEGAASDMMVNDGNTTAEETDVSLLPDSKVEEIANKIMNDAASVKLNGYSDADIKKITQKFSSLYPEYEFIVNQDKTVTVSKKAEKNNILIYVVILAAAVFLIAVVVITVLVIKKKKNITE